MASVVELVMSIVNTLQAALAILTAGLNLTGYMYPESASVQNGATYDFIVVGAGSAGCVIANRLTEIPSVRVLHIDAGGDPRLESVLPGIFTLQPLTEQDYNITSSNDGRTAQNLKNGVVGMTQGKMLGGSSSLHHMIHVRGNPRDYKLWANAANDESWNYDNLIEYFVKSEKVEDEAILKSNLARYHGTAGILRLTTQRSDENEAIFTAFAELGLQKVISTNTPVFTTGISEPLFTIADGKRQSGAEYIRPLTDRPNFHLLKNTQVTKVLFDDNKNAIGVEAVTADGETVTYTARIEVVLAAGALHTPQLLMLSGVGPSDHLKSFNIPVVSDLPVGKNLHDHVSAILVHTLQEGEAVTAPVNPHLFPVPLTTAYAALNNSQSYPDYQTINLIFSPDSTALVQFCSAVFSYKDEICQKFYDGGAGRATLFTINNLMMPYSRGEVLLSSSDPNDQPIIKHGTLSNDVDLDTMALSLQDFARILKTKPFQAAGSKFIDLDFPECRQYTKGSFNYWRCYALSMSATMWHYSSTASMGPVLDSRLRVKGVQKLRVVDASAMPNTISGNINAAVVVLAEKAADLIKKDTGAAPRMN